MLEQRQFCTFLLHGLLCGLDVRVMQEVLRGRPVTPAPLASRLVHGLLNLRGQIVVAIDLRACLQLPTRSAERSSVHLIVRTNQELMAFLVDEPGDVIEVADSALEPLPANLHGPARDLVESVAKLPDRLLHILDTSAVVEMVVRLSGENFMDGYSIPMMRAHT